VIHLSKSTPPLPATADGRDLNAGLCKGKAVIPLVVVQRLLVAAVEDCHTGGGLQIRSSFSC